MVLFDSIFGIVSLCGMCKDTGIPDVGCSQLPDFLQSLRSEVIHFPASVFGQASVARASRVTVAEQTGEYLVDDYFFCCVHTSISLL